MTSSWPALVGAPQCRTAHDIKHHELTRATATVMIVVPIWLPNWVTYSVTAATGETVEKHIGLHKSCSTLDDPYCRDFPPKELCEGERYFCSMWRTVGFLASFTTLLCLGGLVTFIVIMSGGKYKRETGWPFAAAMLTLVSVVEFAAISIVVSRPAVEELLEDRLIDDRHTFTTTTTSSRFPDGTLMFLSTSAQLEPLSVCWVLLVLPFQPTYFLLRKAMISSRTRLMRRKYRG